MTLGETESVLFGTTFCSKPNLSVVFLTVKLASRKSPRNTSSQIINGPAFEKIAIIENRQSNQTFNFLILRWLLILQPNMKKWRLSFYRDWYLAELKSTRAPTLYFSKSHFSVIILMECITSTDLRDKATIFKDLLNSPRKKELSRKRQLEQWRFW